ncbi:hypothetical protein M406DRAFT_342145 [Cryphonectria parasitica EP155]|uniref:3-keto-steroid reductase n=1 Tax=Cryphonectria parasitica (strain ATCC 38755 / EP155) TaxID=660469 RepID=A0A9P4XVF5_CRYP1|nr:uncharacterized protein M406DRAFT_342145 [Cryphonectria parasitica EP155]KAF3761325.1 hypothetical protein M406DRAFT_342145 [Cryphonectria parasitica EP155]
MAPAAPWDSVPARDTLFVLVTGANSGVGHGICERLIDEFLSTRNRTSHLVLLPTTRSARKSSETVSLLRGYLVRAASSRASPQEAAVARVHISSVQLDLCDLSTVQRAADQLLSGTVPFEGLGELRIPRLDAVIFNAGLGGWSHVSWFGFFWDIVTQGWVQATTRPRSKRSKPGLTVKPLPGQEDSLGLVFCANVFGHYLFAHYLVPLLSRPDQPTNGGIQQDGDGVVPAPARIIWQSSVDPALRHFSLDDFQALKSTAAYESSKMLTDLLCLTAALPSTARFSSRYLSSSLPSSSSSHTPKIYLAHPGIVATTMFPLHFTLMWAYILGTSISRWLGSPWHPVVPYKAAVATVWLALSSQAELDAQGAGSSKWGSCTDFWGNTMVKRTEVDGWGWTGNVESPEHMEKEDAGAIRVLRKSVGRSARAIMVTEESRAEFEEIGAKCWAKMESLREEWEGKISPSKAG